MKSSCLILVGAVLWGMIGLFVRHLTPLGFSAIELVTLRSYITALCLLALLFVTDRKKLQMKLRHLPLFLGTGILSFLFFNTCYFKTMDYASLSVAAILLYTAPFFVMGMSAVFFREKITGKKLLALVVAFLGCVLVSRGGSGEFNLETIGILWGLGAGFGYALYSIFAKFALKHYDTLTVITYTFLVASLGGTFLCNPLSVASSLTANPQSVGILLGYGILTGAAAYYCYTKGLKQTPPGKASVLATLEPVVATVCSLFLGETVGLTGFLGIGLVIFAVLFLGAQSE